MWPQPTFFIKFWICLMFPSMLLFPQIHLLRNSLPSISTEVLCIFQGLVQESFLVHKALPPRPRKKKAFLSLNPHSTLSAFFLLMNLWSLLLLTLYFYLPHCLVDYIYIDILFEKREPGLINFSSFHGPSHNAITVFYWINKHITLNLTVYKTLYRHFSFDLLFIASTVEKDFREN